MGRVWKMQSIMTKCCFMILFLSPYHSHDVVIMKGRQRRIQWHIVVRFFSPPHLFLVLIWYHHDGVMHSLSRAKFFIVAYQGMRRNMFRVFNYSMCLHFHKDKWGLIIILFYGKPWGKMLKVHVWEEGASVKFIPILWYHASETTILTFSFFLLSNGV